jgi:hypothetical protein
MKGPISDGSGRLRVGLVGGRSLLRLYGSVNIAVDVVGPDPIQHSISVKVPATAGYARSRQPGDDDVIASRDGENCS